ncbi:hypothetical protein L0P88_08785 [Muricauda sp. SCSIO 64092]|uniref:hypothetical protein n=1 Tax=Allomuricauda sp. SCSIO 64092 TaxID=2908842 RepID=UPI001FF4E7EF|nr:hypothetical protein [Muricauda sp. SCSIO 64092]UOY08634.1 hypothetical protein L0P88_08785 [Muricauda sp. SCSIO 64092]
MKTPIMALSVSFLFMALCLGQKTRAELLFKDGAQLKGLAELSPSKTIRFKEHPMAKRQWYTFNEVDTLKLYYDIEPTIYVNLQVKNKILPKFLEIAQKGKKVVAYHETSIGYMVPAAFPNGGFDGVTNTGRFYKVGSSYLRKTNEKEAIHLGSNQLFTKNFKKAASNFFADCPELVNKILDKEFKRKHLEEIIAFYNNQCE